MSVYKKAVTPRISEIILYFNLCGQSRVSVKSVKDFESKSLSCATYTKYLIFVAPSLPGGGWPMSADLNTVLHHWVSSLSSLLCTSATVTVCFGHERLTLKVTCCQQAVSGSISLHFSVLLLFKALQGTFSSYHLSWCTVLKSWIL